MLVTSLMLRRIHESGKNITGLTEGTHLLLPPRPPAAKPN